MAMAHLLILGLAVASGAADAPSKVRLINEAQAKECTALGIVSHSKLAMWSVDKATQALLKEALKKAEKSGANAAVLMPLTSNRNIYTVMLQTYKCPDQ